MKLSSVLSVLAVTVLVVGGLLSHLASSYPDGLEWSIEKVTGSPELEGGGDIAEWASGVQDHTAVLPDYAFKDSEKGTSFSGVAGSAVVLLLCLAIGVAFRKRRAVPVQEQADGKD